jgi:carbon starvation protein CstA
VRILFVALRVVVAAAIAVAAFSQLAHTLGRRAADGIDDPAFYVTNFFSFFTIDSNLLSVVALLIGAVVLVRFRDREPQWFTVLRLAATTYMTVTLVVYNTLLRGIELPQGETLPWSNEILHVVGPLYVLLDWLFAPGRNRLEWSRIWVVVVFPLIWTAYTLVRGTIVVDIVSGLPWYPYPFLNPSSSDNGYLSVAFYVILITGIFLATAAGAIAVSRRWGSASVVAAK